MGKLINKLEATVTLESIDKKLVLVLPCKGLEDFCDGYFAGSKPAITDIYFNYSLDDLYIGTNVFHINTTLLTLNTFLEENPKKWLPILFYIDKVDTLVSLADYVISADDAEYTIASCYYELARKLLKQEFKKEENFEDFIGYIDIDTYADNLKHGGMFEELTINGFTQGFKEVV